MSNKENTQEYKNRLNNALEHIEHDMKEEFGVVRKSGKKVLKRAALLAGGGLLVYTAISLLTSSKKKSEVDTRHVSATSVGPGIKAIILALLLEVAKKQLADLIKNKLHDLKSPEQD